MTNYIISFCILLAAQLLYFLVAERYHIIDKPNARSSHSRSTIRGGGIIFPLAALIWFFYAGFEQPWMMAGLLLVAVALSTTCSPCREGYD
jgi:UDP-GlcNAc:undecaprenyl-phosphate GlcNAc-1-phosphate transferase